MTELLLLFATLIVGGVIWIEMKSARELDAILESLEQSFSEPEKVRQEAATPQHQ